MQPIIALASDALLHLTEQEGGPICILRAAITAIRQRPEDACQSAFKFDPVSASNFDPFERRGLAVALASSELAGVAETWRARAA